MQGLAEMKSNRTKESEQVYPLQTLPVARWTMSGSESAREIGRARRTSREYIKVSLESLNCTRIINRIEIERQNTKTFRTVRSESSIRILLFLLTGALTGLLGVFVESLIDYWGDLKFKKLEEIIMSDFQGELNDLALFALVRFVGVVIPVAIGASLVIFIAPFAAGGGVAQSIAYLNGVNVPNVLSIKGLVVKSFSTVCSCISGLSAGKEGPMLHMGTIIGGNLPSLFPWQEFKLDRERIDLGSAGFGAGLAVVFGAPIGGLLLALEEAVSFLELSIMWKIYLCCVVSYAVGTVAISLVQGVDVKLNNPQLLTFGTLSSDVTDYEWFELLPFSIMGVIGGLSGALLTKIHVYVAVFRNNYVKTKTRQIISVLVVVLFVTFFQVSSIWLLRTCSNLPQNLNNNTTKNYHKLYCPSDKRSDMSLLYSKTQSALLRIFFGKDLIHSSSLALYSVIYFILLVMTMGIPISAGLFIPQVVLGAAWGRCFGTVLNQLVGDPKWARPAKYAYLGAAAQLSGTVGRTFSILVVMVEASGSISLSFPLMVVVSITNVVCNFFILPIYETQMHLMGLPFLSHRIPPVSCNVSVTKCMSEPPLITLPPAPTVSTIIDALKGNDHNGFPIVKTENSETVLIGLVLRQQLLALLKCDVYKHTRPSNYEYMVHCFKNYMESSRKKLNSEEVIDSVDTMYYNTELDLSPFYHRYPSTVLDNLPMTKAYELFRSLSVRHLVVVNSHYEPVGMVTRKDLAVYHTTETCCKVKVKKLRFG